ncbi:MAG: hypothetical protein V4574_04960 [Pseudomonadota bacterium]
MLSTALTAVLTLPFLLSAPLAQPLNAAPIAAVSPGCELHIWLQPEYKAKTFAIVTSMDGIFAGRNQSDQDFLASVITTDFLRDMVRDADFTSFRAPAPLTVSVEDGSKQISEIRRSPAPFAARSSDCYSELFITTITYGKAPIHGSGIGLAAERRRFVPGAAKPSVRKVFGGAEFDMGSTPDEARLTAEARAAFRLAFVVLLKEAAE